MSEVTAPRESRPILTMVMEVAVLVTAAIVLGRMAYEALKPPPPPPPSPKLGGMSWTSHANNNAAHFGFTNLTPEVRVACVKGIVTALQSKVSIESSVVCTGEMKPNTTLTLDASWPKGAPDDICYKENSFGKVLDWSKCQFTHEDVAPVLVPAGVASSAPPRASASASPEQR